MGYRIERHDGSVDGLGDDVVFETEDEAWEAAETAFGSDPASQDGGVRSWLRVVDVERNTERDVVKIGGAEIPLDIAAGHMDDEIRDRLHDEMAPCEAQAFADAYMAAHREKFGVDLVIN